MRKLEINCDLGEGLATDAQIMPLIDRCNIACGGHFGDNQSMEEAVSLAQKHNIKIGAHPSYPDKINFGRETIQITPEDLAISIEQQINHLLSVAEKIDHIKLHGALYNESVHDVALAILILDTIQKYDVPILAPHKSAIADIAKTKAIPIIYEAFGDRNYNDDLSLVSRKYNNAIKTDVGDIINHVKSIRAENVTTTSNNVVPIIADSICIHGDNYNAINILIQLRKLLNEI